MLELLYIDIYITLGIFLRKKVIETAGLFKTGTRDLANACGGNGFES